MNANWKNIVAAVFTLAIVLMLSASIDRYGLELQDFRLENLGRVQTEVFFKFCMFGVIAFFIDFKSKKS